jgi:hypothetical protein
MCNMTRAFPSTSSAISNTMIAIDTRESDIRKTCVRANLLQWKSNVLHNLSVYLEPWVTARNAHAPHCHLTTCPVLLIFSTLSHNGMIFGGKKVNEYKICVLVFSTLFTLRRMGRGIKNVNYPSLLSNFNETPIFSTDFRIIIKHQIS